MEIEEIQEKQTSGNESVIVTDPKTKYVNKYSMSSRLKRNLDDKIIPSLHKSNKDCVLVLDGKEGAGKSTLAIQIAKYVDPSLNLSRIVFSPDDFREAILTAKKGQAIVYDEAFTGFSSRSSLSPVNRVLVSLAMQMRQKNLFIIIVLPTIFLLDKYMALFRTRALIHVFESRGKRGYFRVFNANKKKYLILRGQKTMTYNIKGLYTNFKGRFYGKFALGSPEVEKKYLKKKEEALANSEKTSMSSAQVKFREQRDLMIWLFRKYTKMKYREMSQLFSDYDFVMSFEQLSKISSRFGDVSSEPVDLLEKGNEDLKDTDDNIVEDEKENNPPKKKTKNI